MATQATENNIMVNYEFLGKSGLKVSNICLGTMTFGKTEERGPTQATEELSHKMLDKFVELGGNFIDTANVYGDGMSEKIIGNWLTGQNRDDIILATKVRGMVGSGPNEIGLSRRHIIKCCEESLERLQTNYIDLYQTHFWDSATPTEETYRTMDDLVRCGKIRYVGLSNLTGWQIQKIVQEMKSMGLSAAISLQQQYSLLSREPEFEPFQVCVNEGIGVIPWSPLKGGMLTGKFKRGEVPAETESRIGFVSKNVSKQKQSSPGWSQYADDESYWNLINLMKRIAQKYNKSIAQVAIRWLLQKNIVPSVIIGATSVEQLIDNMGAGNGWSLSQEDMIELDNASQPRIPYPYEMVWRANKQRINTFNPTSFVKNKE